MLWRFIITFFKGKIRNKALLGETTKISMRVMPMDLDFLFHVNNGVYFSYLDHGRMDMIFRNGIYEVCRENSWYGVVASESMKFYKSLKMFNKFEIETTGRGFDNKYFFVHQKIISQGKVMASAIVKIRFLKKSGGAVSPQEIFNKLNQTPQNNLGNLSEEWHGIENKYLI